VSATCTLFLAGKAEETPKKCRDLIKTVRSLTNDNQFSTFGADPREEVMTLERVLLQTIKFDLQARLGNLVGVVGNMNCIRSTTRTLLFSNTLSA